MILMLCAASAVQAIKPLLTEGFDKYNNSFKVDLVSVGLVAPQITWEHYTNSRFSYGVGFQAHFRNRSNAIRTFEVEERPTQVMLDGTNYDIIKWESLLLDLYAIISKDDGTYEVKWDRKYVGAMVSPEGRFYFGRKPDRGFYGMAKIDVGLFHEQFNVSVKTESREYRNSLTPEEKETDARYQKYMENEWHLANVEDGETFFALGCGAGMGYQCWFKQNSHWGIDINCLGKCDWKFSEDENTWEWFWGIAFPVDFNLALKYRF